MAAVPFPWHLLTMQEFGALPEDNSARYELEEGILVVSPRPTPLHQRVSMRLAQALNQQLPPQWEALTELEVVVIPTEPATVRAPDVLVIPSEWNEPRTPAGKVLLAVETISPGSRRKDTLVKPLEYAEAGIPYYWVIDLDAPPSITAYTLVEGHYEESQTVAAAFETVVPFQLRFDLRALVAPRGEAG